ncbi:MAG: hypothetical protein DCC71_13110 [Proteobacteria bacterium]|nr:MAG: hypothetical protein DCC71_13110 [Pseudomonadota bacterium]
MDRLLLLVASLLLLPIASPARSAVLTVDSTEDLADDDPGDGICAAGGLCTLRAAIQEANRNGEDDDIELLAGTYALAIPGRGEDEGATGDLDVGEGGRTITIRGAGVGWTVVDALALDRVFHAAPESRLEIEQLSIRGGSEPTWPDPGRPAAGGAIDARDAYLRLADVLVAENEAVENAAILAGQAVLERVTVRDNASYTGAAVVAVDLLDLAECTVAWNTAIDAGGGVEAGLALYVENSTIVANDGCGVTAYGSLSIRHATIDENAGCGVLALGPVEMWNSVLARNGGGASERGDCDFDGAMPHALVHNAASDESCPFSEPGSLVGIDPQLGPLEGHGGPTITQMPLAGSPLLDAADDAVCRAIDQRGAPRPNDGDGDGVAHCDIGAVEAPEPAAALAAAASAAGLALAVRARFRNR